MNVSTFSNIPVLNVNEIINKLSRSYSKLIKDNISIKSFPSVMLWGAPGVGKSQAIKQIAKEITNQTGKQTKVTDVRLLLFNPIDLRGIPTVNQERTLSKWLKPQIFDMDESSDIINILFLDEISSAPPSVQAAAYQITLDRVIGEHKLPDNCIVIAAGNRLNDQSVVYKMPKALANRLLHFEVENDFLSWKEWAIKNNINEKVVGFLSFKSNYLIDELSKSENLAYATPRSWEMVSNVLNNISDDIDEVESLISGLIGVGTTIEFKTWCNVYKDLPNIQDIFEGKPVKIPSSTDTIYALISSMVRYAKNYKDDLFKIGNSIKYACDLPADFSLILIQDYMCLEKNYKHKLLTLPEFNRWYNTKGRILNVII